MLTKSVNRLHFQHLAPFVFLTIRALTGKKTATLMRTRWIQMLQYPWLNLRISSTPTTKLFLFVNVPIRPSPPQPITRQFNRNETLYQVLDWLCARIIRQKTPPFRWTRDQFTFDNRHAKGQGVAWPSFKSSGRHVSQMTLEKTFDFTVSVVQTTLEPKIIVTGLRQFSFIDHQTESTLSFKMHW